MAETPGDAFVKDITVVAHLACPQGKVIGGKIDHYIARALTDAISP
jgi:hypothetical protein